MHCKASYSVRERTLSGKQSPPAHGAKLCAAGLGLPVVGPFSPVLTQSLACVAHLVLCLSSCFRRRWLQLENLRGRDLDSRVLLSTAMARTMLLLIAICALVGRAQGKS